MSNSPEEKKIIRRQAVYALIAALIVAALFWLGGYNFDTRGDTARMAGICCLLAAGLVMLLPFLN